MFPTLRRAVPIALPVMIGYFTVGATFGLTAAEAGFGWFWPVVISLIQFAGAAQFLIVAMVSQGAGFIDTAAVVFLLNLRHMFYGLPFLAHRPEHPLARLLMIFWLSDETYSLLTSRKPADPPRVQVTVAGLNYVSWATGTLVGSTAGQLLPLSVDSFSFALWALFAILLTEQLRANRSFVPVIAGFVGVAVLVPLKVDFGLGMFISGIAATATILGWHWLLTIRQRGMGG